MHLFQSLEEVTMLLLKLDKEHFPVIFGVEIVGEQIVYLLIKGDQSFLCPASLMPKRLCRSCVHGKMIIRIARRLLATT